jgi:DNA-binding NtrC family response regulator
MAALRDTGPANAPAAAGDGQIIGASPAMRRLFSAIQKISASDASVFISGESGTGKELTALAIHERSARRDGPFVAINCGGIPQHLMQSELFGHERGAFTGANARKIGRIETAQGGTLFLDEIGDMPLDAQASLLRFLQERKIERVGAHESIPVDLRVISATHVDLDAAMHDGRFRADLFHRLCVLRIDEPPLRERGADIEMLAQHTLRKYKADNKRKLRGFATTAIDAMYAHDWPGNVRELVNRVRRAIVMAEGRLMTHDDLNLPLSSGRHAITLAQAREAADIEAINNAIRQTGHRLEDAAHALGISRATLYRLTTEYGLRTETVGALCGGEEIGGASGRPDDDGRRDALPGGMPAKRRAG